MHKTIYVDIDEEITSVIDRIRREGAPDVFLVVPKNAMLCQGILNLKLLKKESERLGKNVMMVTNDKQAKKVIERAGLTISNKPINEADDHRKPKRASLPDRAAKEALTELGSIDDGLREKILSEGSDIGSASFFDTGTVEDFGSASPAAPNHSGANAFANDFTPPMEVDVKAYIDHESRAVKAKTSPSRAAIDLRMSTAKIPAAPAHSRVNHQAPKNNALQVPHRPEPGQQRFSDHGATKNHPALHQSLHSSNKSAKGHSRNNKEMSFSSSWQTEEAEEFFADYNQKLKEETFAPNHKKPLKKINVFAYSKWFIIAAAAALLISIAGYYLTYSTVAITIHPSEKQVDLPIEIKAKPSVAQANYETLEISATDQSVQIAKTLDFEATGEKSISETGKSKGTVTIINNYSSSPQVLVATTRILSKDGKLFRLASQVTVPGMKGAESGKVEAEVVADETGKSYDIGPSTFTIEGFKGTPKYDKFEVSSSSDMKGGENTAGSKVKVVSPKDIEKARQQTIDELENNLQQEIKDKIQAADSNVFTYILKKDISKASSSAKEGEQADAFSYTVVEDISVRVVSQADIDQAIKAKAQQARESGYELKSVSEATLDKSNVNKDSTELTLSYLAKAAYIPTIDTENIRRGILGKSEDEVQTLLSGYQEIDKVEIKFSPVWKSVVPGSADKVNIEIISQTNNK